MLQGDLEEAKIPYLIALVLAIGVVFLAWVMRGEIPGVAAGSAAPTFQAYTLDGEQLWEWNGQSWALITPDDPGGEPYCSHRCMVKVEATSTYQPWTPLIPSFQMFARSTLHIE